MMPIALPPNVDPHFYRGGSRLAELRGFRSETEFGPEDWLASTVHRAGTPAIGRSRLADGRLFADVVAADPAGWLGDAAGGPNGPSDTGILVKLLDADQRLPVHVHPDRRFAAGHLHSCYGKTEAWYVLAADGENAAVWLGFAEAVDPHELAAATDAQDSQWMLCRMNRIDISPGDGILVPAGTAHAIGGGVFVVEVQEPTDMSIVLEWSITNSTREQSHLDIGFDLARTAISHQALTAEAIASLVSPAAPPGRSPTPIRILPAVADAFFDMSLLAPPSDTTCAALTGFSVAVILDGAGAMVGAAGEVSVSRGQALAVPAAFGPWSVTGDVRIVQCRPGPAP
jgi:mannose-6-phosphate isomerase